MTTIKTAILVCLILFGVSVLDSISPDTGVFTLILASLTPLTIKENTDGEDFVHFETCPRCWVINSR